MPTQKVQVIDSHTAGEPTRIVISGAPDLGRGSISEKFRAFREKHDAFRCAIVKEPRGSDVLVGALLLEPGDKSCVAAVIFFNNVGYLGMCGHGTVGSIETLRHLRPIKPGEHRIETAVGQGAPTLHLGGALSVRNIPR